MSSKGRADWLNKGYEFYNNIRPYYCKHCGSRFNDWDVFNKHIDYYLTKITDKIRENIDPDYSDKMKEELVNRRASENEDYKLLIESYNINKRKKPFVCTICGKAFRSKRVGLKPHLERMHGIKVDTKIKTEIKTEPELEIKNKTKPKPTPVLKLKARDPRGDIRTATIQTGSK